jgi:uncharacterized protein (DUF2062 family)
VSFLRRSWEFTKRLYRAARDERASPREIGWAIGIGVFVGCSPTLGFHGVVALGAATLFKKNRLFCWLGSRICNVVTLPFIILAEVQVAHFVRTGAWLAIDTSNMLAQAPGLVLDWALGLVPVGGPIAVACGLAAFGLATLRDRRRARKDETHRKLASTEGLSHNVLHERESRLSGAPPPPKP